MRAMVLAAGKGERLRPLTDRRAKPAIEVAGIPLVVRALARLQEAGFSEVAVNTHQDPLSIRAAVNSWQSRLHLDVSYSHEEEIQGTGGALMAAREILGPGPVLVMNPDVVVDVDLLEVIRTHRRSGATATLVLWDGPVAGRYGRLGVDPQGWVVSIPRLLPGPVETGGMYVGIQILEEPARRLLPEGPSEIFPAVYRPLIRSGQPVRAFLHQGIFLDCGYPPGYLNTCFRVMAGEGALPGWELPRRETVEAGPVLVAPDARVDPEARLGPWTVVGVGARIEAGARLERTVVWSGAHVPGEASWTGGVVCQDGEFVPIEESTEA